MKTMTSQRMTFEEFRAFMWETPKGQVVDSLIAIEVGIQDYYTFWEAHLDFLETMQESHEQNDVILEFLVAVAEMIDLAEASDDIDKVLGELAYD